MVAPFETKPPAQMLRSRVAWAIFAGILFALAQPKFEIAGLAWIAPAVLLLATLGAAGNEAFRIGYVAGIAQQLITLYWLLFIPFPAGAIAGWILLSAYLAIYPAIWCWFAWRIFPNRVQAPLFDPAPLEALAETSWPRRILWAVLCAAAWVALEMAAARMLSGFPWNFLGISQFRMLPVIQIASITSVYGVSFVIVFFAVSLFSAGMLIPSQPLRGRRWLSEIVPALALILVVALFGLRQISGHRTSDRKIRAALIQPSIPQTLIWDPSENTNRFNELIRLSEMSLAAKPDLVIWPEAAVPNLLRYDRHTWDSVTNFAIAGKVWMILGADDAVPREDTSRREADFYNSSFVISPTGQIAGAYRKRRLVAFGEFVPFADQLPFMKKLSPVGENSFSAGEEATPFNLPALDLTTSVLICFEDTFPQLAREYVREDTDFLLNLTNNGWFGESAAQWQHAAAAMFRAIENRVPLVRCANNGLTCWVDEIGRLHEVYLGDSDDIYGRGFKTAYIPLLKRGEKREATFYNRNGDVFGWGCVGIAVLALAASARKTGEKRPALG